jgi:hypothetical protein
VSHWVTTETIVQAPQLRRPLTGHDGPKGRHARPVVDPFCDEAPFPRKRGGAIAISQMRETRQEQVSAVPGGVLVGRRARVRRDTAVRVLLSHGKNDFAERVLSLTGVGR